MVVRLSWMSVGDGFAVADSLKVKGAETMKQVGQERFNGKAMKHPA